MAYFYGLPFDKIWQERRSVGAIEDVSGYVCSYPFPQDQVNADHTDKTSSSYSEAIETLYITNTFCFSDSATLIEFPRTLLPTRVPLLRHLVLHFDFRNQKLGTWLQTCALLRTFPCLQTLTITFLLPEVRSYIDWENESIFSPLVGVSVKGEFVVYVDWLETERDREVAADACFMIVRRKNVEVDEERTRERIRVPHVRSNNSSMWVLRDDGPSDPDGV